MLNGGSKRNFISMLDDRLTGYEVHFLRPQAIVLGYEACCDSGTALPALLQSFTTSH